jgi:hypothetical protein
MKAYLIATGTIFALVTVAHIARIGEIRQQVGRDPLYVAGWALLTLLAGGMAVWAWRLFRSLSNPPAAAGE